MTDIKIVSLIFIVFCFVLFIIKQKNLITLQHTDKGNKKNKAIFYIFSLFIITIISQNTHLNYETIDWDTNSYLVASLDILNGYLPYENSWESKQPLLYYIYAFLITISQADLIVFKLLNDLLLFIISYFLFHILYARKNNLNLSFFAALTYILLMSLNWGQVEKSELYCIFFISLIIFMNTIFEDRKYLVLLTGFLASLSILINLGSILFLLPISLTYILKNKDSKKFLTNVLNFGAGLLIPIVFISIIYYKNNLWDIFLVTNINIPFGYTESSFNFVREFSNFIKSYYEYNPLLYLSLLFIFISSLIPSTKIVLNLFRNKEINYKFQGLLYLLTSILIYYIAGHGYYHHLYYLIFFSSLVLFDLIDELDLKVLSVLILSSLIFSSVTHYSSSIYNLNNIETIYNNYPLYNVAKEIKEIIDEEDEILATDGVLTLFYLNKANMSYIIHPSNHKEDFITSELIKINYLIDDELMVLLDQEPKVIICGNNNHFNCEIYDWNKNYIELDVKKYIEFKPYQLYNPASEKGERVRVFIRNE